MNQTGVLKSAWRYRWLVALIVAVFGIAAAVLSVARTDTYVAEATVVLEDPNASNLLALNSSETSSRSVANQLEVFRSGLVTSKAAEIATAQGIDATESDIVDNTTFLTLDGTDVITVTYADSEPERAERIADGIITAYDEVQLDQRRSSNAKVLERLDITDQLLVSNLQEIQAQIDSILSERNTEAQIDATLNRVSTVQSQILEATNAEVRAALVADLADLQAQMEALQLASQIESGSSDLAPLLESRSRIEDQLTAIDDRRTELQLESAVEGSGIAFVSPASITDVSTGAGNLFTILGGILLGAMVALGVAYGLGNRRREFLDSSEPETVVGSPFLAEIPRWSGFAKSPAPVRDDPRSLTSEAFRFAYATVDIRMTRDGFKSVNFVSANVEDGKSTLVANTALAAARTGKRVLLIDADFGSQTSSRLLVDNQIRPGLTDLVLGNSFIESAVATVAVPDGGGTLEVMGRGTEQVTAPDFFANPMVGQFMARAEAVYDMILIDGPPLLQVAYASTIAGMTDSLVLVIPHGSRTRDAERLARRVELIGSPVLGYMYNMAPRQAGRQAVGGSMRDVLGDRSESTVTPAEPKR